MQVATCGSEIVGLIPLESILMAADYYIKKENILVLEESQKVKLVITNNYWWMLRLFDKLEFYSFMGNRLSTSWDLIQLKNLTQKKK
jgi:hypothetical protein